MPARISEPLRRCFRDPPGTSQSRTAMIVSAITSWLSSTRRAQPKPRASLQSQEPQEEVTVRKKAYLAARDGFRLGRSGQPPPHRRKRLVNQNFSNLRPLTSGANRRSRVRLWRGSNVSLTRLQQVQPGAAARLSTGPVVWNGLESVSTQSLINSRSAAPGSRWMRRISASSPLRNCASN